MKLRMISEIQHKFPSTNMDRTNVTGVYGVASINDYFHLVHPGGQGHAKRRHRRRPKKIDVEKP